MPVNVTIAIIINVQNVEFLFSVSLTQNMSYLIVIRKASSAGSRLKKGKELNAFSLNPEIDLQPSNA